MKKFVLKTLLLFVICAVPMVAILLMADGTTDPYYLRFTSPRQTSLILGTSRAAQGLQPEVIDSILKPALPDLRMYNYGFALYGSPYGPAYYRSVQKKLEPGTTNGVFILTVDPWSISKIGGITKKPIEFFEDEHFVAKTHFVNIYPNIEYLLESSENRFWLFLRGNRNDRYLVHDDGWLETFSPMTEDSIRYRMKKKMRSYTHIYKDPKLSTARVEYLNKTISFLQQHGKVYLFRMPVINEFRVLEDQLFPGFEDVMARVAKENNVPYFDLYSPTDTLTYTDGDHLWKTSGKKVSTQLANHILVYLSNVQGTTIK